MIENNNLSIVQINSESNVLKPAHIGDAGYDVIAASDPIIVGKRQLDYYYSSIDYIEYDTDLIISPQEGYHTFAFPRSSISKTNLTMANSIGLIDNGYRGTIKFRFKYVPQPDNYIIGHGGLLLEVDKSKIYKKGDKIGQLVFAKTYTPDLHLVSSFEETNRNSGGFGSTGA
jgi:dUTP pyrophosphatase